jgi:hypothetical protein
MVSSVLLGDPLDKDCQTYENFARLVGLRNALIHQKPITDPPTQKNAGNIQRMVAYFEQRKWTFTADGAYIASWMDKIMTPEIARWACRASSAIILNIVDRFGSDPHPMGNLWSNARADPRIVEPKVQPKSCKS